MRDPYSALLGWLSHARCLPPWPFSPGPSEATSLREVPASLALLAPAPGRPPPTRPGKVLRFLALHHPADVGAKKGRVGFGLAPLSSPRPGGEDPSPTRHTREARVGVE